MAANETDPHGKTVERVLNYHWAHPQLLNPNHMVTISLIGAGGTGSYVLTKLALLNISLKKLGHPGLHVQVWDPDVVTNANVGRQLFYESDMGKYKASVLVNRCNIAFGTNWTAINKEACKATFEEQSNIYITCVDNIKARKEFYKFMNNVLVFVKREEQWLQPYYWIDAGNVTSKGQVILGTITDIPQPKGNEQYEHMNNIFDVFPELQTMKEDKNLPSCSLTEALRHQDLFINSFIADWVSHILWCLFRYARIHYNGVFINIDSPETTSINL